MFIPLNWVLDRTRIADLMWEWLARKVIPPDDHFDVFT